MLTMYFSYKKKSKKKANLEAKEDQRKEGSHIGSKHVFRSNLDFPKGELLADYIFPDNRCPKETIKNIVLLKLIENKYTPSPAQCHNS